MTYFEEYILAVTENYCFELASNTKTLSSDESLHWINHYVATSNLPVTITGASSVTIQVI